MTRIFFVAASIVMAASNSVLANPGVFSNVFSVFDGCIENALTGRSDNEESLVNRINTEQFSQSDATVSTVPFQLEIGDHHACAIVVDARHFDARDFRQSVEKFGKNRSRGELTRCGWGHSDASGWSYRCFLSGAEHSDGSKHYFDVELGLRSREFAFLVVRPTLSFGADGYAKLH